jgi:hypothetical protein
MKRAETFERAADELAYPLRREHGAQQTHDVDHQRQQHQDLGDVHDEEMQRRAEGRALHAGEAVDDPVGEGFKHAQPRNNLIYGWR